MRRRGLLLLALMGPALLGLALSPGVGSYPAAADTPAVTPLAIDVAIEGGVARLLEKQRANGTWGSGSKELGHTALGVFALLHAGLREDQIGRQAKQLRKSLAFIDKHGPGRPKRRAEDPGTYTTSLLILLLRERARPIDRARMQRLVDLLVRTQAKNGQWWYYGRPGKTGKGGPKTGDNSNTQFAVLALAAAASEGLDVPKATLERARTWWRDTQKDDGGWGYASGGGKASATTASMTAAAVSCLGALNSLLDGAPIPEPTVDPATPPTPNPAKAPQVSIGLEWLREHFSVTKNHGPSQGAVKQRQRKAGRGWLHYYLWAIERAFVLTEMERIGDHDWYREGAAQLLKTQAKDGSWRGEHPLYATSFALLFLTRAADPPRAFTNPKPKQPSAEKPGPVVTGPDEPDAPDDPAAPDAPPAEQDPGGTLEDWLEADLKPGELSRRCRLRGASTLRPLVTFLQDPDKDIRRRAWEALTELLPDERIFRADRHPLARGRLVSWLQRNERFLKLADGRFRVL